MSDGEGSLSHRFAWWEDLCTTQTDVRMALKAAARRTRDVDDDVGVLSPLSLPRSQVKKGLLAETAAMGIAAGGPFLRSHSRGWEVAPGKSLDMRSFLGRQHELTDIVAELMPGTDRLMVHIAGPWTFGASVEYRGHPLCFDRPAFRDTALALAEGVREFCDAVGASVVHIHERRFPEVTSTLVGATEFETMSVDRDIAINVERRFIEQVRGEQIQGESTLGEQREVVVDAGVAYPELIHAGATTLIVDELSDDVARLIDSGASVAWRVPEHTAGSGEVGATSEELAREVMKVWRQWTFDTIDSTPQIDLVAVGQGVMTPNAAAELARTVRGAAALLHRN